MNNDKNTVDNSSPLDIAIEKYGNIKVRFSYYYKYRFYFRNEEKNIGISVGGDCNSIYGMEIRKEMKIIELLLEEESKLCIDNECYKF